MGRPRRLMRGPYAVYLGIPMNDSEKSVNKYLLGLGLGRVVHEPDGNIPPDFSVAGRIAVEVRRLNRNEETAGRHRGLEVTSKPLNALIIKALASMGHPIYGTSWFVCYTYRRPLPPWRKLERLVISALEEVRQQPRLEDVELRITGRLRLSFTRASRLRSDLFVLGGCIDLDSGGFVIAEMASNIQLCIDEKSAKISFVRNRHPEWWLALEDRICYGDLNEDDRDQLRQLIRRDAVWNKIILVNPLKPSAGFEL